MDDVAYRRAEARKITAGHRAVGVLEGILPLLSSEVREIAAPIIEEFYAAHAAAVAAIDAPDREAA